MWGETHLLGNHVAKCDKNFQCYRNGHLQYLVYWYLATVILAINCDCENRKGA